MKGNINILEIENDNKSITISELNFLGKTIDDLVDLNYKVSKDPATINEIKEIGQLKSKINNICDNFFPDMITDNNQWTYLNAAYECHSEKLYLYGIENDLI